MADTKTHAEPQTKAAATPTPTKQPETPEKALGPSRLPVQRAAANAALPPPDGTPPAARAAEVLATSDATGGAAGRARLMRAMQGSLGNARVGQLVRPTRAPIQRQADGHQASDGVPESVTTAIQSGGGQPLAKETRERMEGAFGGADFSGVRVHTGSGSARAARDIQAKAFTTGQDIHFGEGQYQPGTQEGDKLLAHELTHTVQQQTRLVSEMPAGGGLSISDPADPHEQAASETASVVAEKLQNHALERGTSTTNPSHKPAVARAMIQREEAGPATATATQLIDKYTSWVGNLDEEELGKDLAERLPGQSILAAEVLNKLGSTDRDDVAYAIVTAASGKLGDIPEWLLIRFVVELVYGVVTDAEEGAISQVWISFGTKLPEVAERNRALWKKSLWESDQLDDYVKPIGDLFATDVVRLADAYLDENQQTLLAEARKYGIDLEGKHSVEPTHPDYLQSVRLILPGVLKLKNQLRELEQLYVGYDLRYYQKTDNAREEPARFDPARRPMAPPKKTESPPWPTWDEVKVQYDRTSAVISAFANLYPTIYLLLQQDKLDALDQAADASKAQQVVLEALQKTYDKIQAAKEEIASGKITHYDLKLLQTQLFDGTGKDIYTPSRPWDQPYYQDIAKDDIKGHEARQFWLDLGLSLAAAAALIAAPFTGGATAAFLVGFGVGIGVGQAGMSWDKYLSLSTLADAKTKDELSLVAQGEVSAQLVDAIIQTVGVFLDVYGARAATAGARASREAFDVAEKGLKKEFAEEARKRALREAGKDIAITGAGTGAAIAMHELVDDEPAPSLEGKAEVRQIDLGAAEAEVAPAPLNRMVIQRAPGPGGSPAAGTTKPPILMTGGEFELYMERAMLKGSVEGLPQMSFVIPGQYTGSGWGIDRIGIVFDEATGRIDVYHLEMKFVWEESKHTPKLGQRAVGTQTGRAWTQKAVDSFLTSSHPKARAGRERLRRALKKVYKVDTITAEHMRSFLHTRLVDAPVRIIIPHWADFSKLYKQVAALIRAGRDVSFVRVFKPR